PRSTLFPYTTLFRSVPIGPVKGKEKNVARCRNTLRVKKQFRLRPKNEDALFGRCDLRDARSELRHFGEEISRINRSDRVRGRVVKPKRPKGFQRKNGKQQTEQRSRNPRSSPGPKLAQP